MKLQELMEASVVRHLLGNIPYIKRTDTTKIVDFRKLKYIGSGVEADIYGGTKAGTAIKIMRFPQGFDVNGVQNNPYLHYVSMCIKNANNPYFPKFTSAKVYEIPFEHDWQSMENDTRREDDQQLKDDKTPPSDFMLIVSMEHLYELDELDLEDAEAVYQEHGMTLDAAHAEADEKAKGEKSLVSVRAMSLKPRNLAKVKQNTDNPQFHQALDLLAPLFKQFGGDTHSGNLMFRKAGNGYQLVFTDPLYPEEHI